MRFRPPQKTPQAPGWSSRGALPANPLPRPGRCIRRSWFLRRSSRLLGWQNLEVCRNSQFSRRHRRSSASLSAAPHLLFFFRKPLSRPVAAKPAQTLRNLRRTGPYGTHTFRRSTSRLLPSEDQRWLIFAVACDKDLRFALPLVRSAVLSLALRYWSRRPAGVIRQAAFCWEESDLFC